MPVTDCTSPRLLPAATGQQPAQSVTLGAVSAVVHTAVHGCGDKVGGVASDISSALGGVSNTLSEVGAIARSCVGGNGPSSSAAASAEPRMKESIWFHLSCDMQIALCGACAKLPDRRARGRRCAVRCRVYM
eukprot:2327271-Prymnesium_polylepis.1